MEVKITFLLTASFLLLTSPAFIAIGLGEEFLYYKLALQWPNSVCNAGVICSKNPEEINTHYQRFLIHGLWPFWANNSILAPCPGNELKSRQLSSTLRNSLHGYWPSLLHPDHDFNFWKHEWEKHGRCLYRVPSAYFNAAIRLRNRFPRDLGLGGQGCPPSPRLYKRIDIYDALSRALGAKGQFKCNMRNDGYQLVEVYICFDSQMTLRNCPYRYINCGNNDQVRVLFPTSDTVRPINGFGEL